MDILETLAKGFSLTSAVMVIIAACVGVWYARKVGPKLANDALLRNIDEFRQQVEDLDRHLQQYRKREQRNEERITTLDEELKLLQERERECREKLREYRHFIRNQGWKPPDE